MWYRLMGAPVMNVARLKWSRLWCSWSIYRVYLKNRTVSKGYVFFLSNGHKILKYIAKYKALHTKWTMFTFAQCAVWKHSMCPCETFWYQCMFKIYDADSINSSTNPYKACVKGRIPLQKLYKGWKSAMTAIRDQSGIMWNCEVFKIWWALAI